MPTRRPFAAVLPFALLPALLLVVGGCSSNQAVVSGPDHPEGPLVCKAMPSKDVVVSPPTVSVQNGVMSIGGTVHRQPGVTGELDGQVVIELFSREGAMLDQPLHAALIPTAVPMNPNDTSRYSPTPFGYVPPAGSTVRARYVTHGEAIKMHMEEGIFDPNGNNGHTGEGVGRRQENGAMPAAPSGGGNNGTSNAP